MPKTTTPAYLAEDGRVLTTDPKFHTWKHPDYIAVKSKDDELHAQFAELNRRIADEISAASAEKTRSRRTDLAHALLDGTEAPTVAARPDLQPMLEHREVLREAMDLSERRLLHTESVVSSAICRQLVGPYIEFSKELLPVLARLAELRDIESRLYAEMECQGTRTSALQNLGFRGENARGNIEAIIKEARELYGVDLSGVLATAETAAPR